MPKRVFIIHGWGGYPEECWFPWLRKELVARRFQVHVPPMPDTDNPSKALWINHLKELVGHCDDDTYFVGHSLGCQTILRYLQMQPPGVKVGGVVFVAGFETLSARYSEPEVQRVLGPWLKDPIHWEAIRGRTKHFVAVFSDNDGWVPLENVEFFSRKLGAETIVLHDMQHFSGSRGITELPIVLEKLEEMAGMIL